MSYKGPIEVIVGEVQHKMENEIIKAVQNVGINVNKIELHKALMYDRKQYTQGFEDGKKYAEFELVRHGQWTRPYNDGYKQCSVCKRIHYGIPWNAKYCPFCGAKMDETDEVTG